MADATRVGIISNPASRHNSRGGLAAIETVLAAYRAVPHCLARDPDEIENALGKLAATGVTQVVLNGGDGTVQAALTTLALRSPFPQPPQLLVLAGGTSNMTAYGLGSHGRPQRLLQRLLTGALETTRQRVLIVQETNGDTRCGFFFNAGGLPQAVSECNAFRERTPWPGMRSALGTGLWITGRLSRMLWGQAPVTAVPIMLCLDHTASIQNDFLVIVLTTLPRLAFGLTPWWGGGSGALRYTGIRRPALRLPLALPGILRGRPPAWADAAAGYESTAPGTAVLTPDGVYALDGEGYQPPAGTELKVSAGPEFEFLRP
ncbi:MAG: diacylglycerol kinase family protein [Immundisolibacter sp.]|uniref:diacylglycerol kinase family protein n=1 Tax=Immundisolibacter sp. TaxID=1934948 RepID=UPI003EE32BCB